MALDHTFIERFFVPLQLALAMLGMGATLRPTDFAGVLRDPAGLVIGLVLQLVMVPALAVLFIHVFHLSPGWAVGLCLVAVVPGGAFSNLLTFLAKGNVPLSISVTVASTTSCVFTVPLILRVVAAAHLPESFAFPTPRIITEIGAYLLGPLVLGMLALRLWSKVSAPLSRWSIRLSVVLSGIITVSALRSGRIKVLEYGWEPPVLILLFGALVTILASHAARLLRRYDEDTTALGIEVGVRNVGVALLLVSYFFPGQGEQGHVLYTCLFYAGASIWFVLPIVIAHRTGRTVVLFRRRWPRPSLATQDP